MPRTPVQLARSLDGLLAFPVTPFDAKGQVDGERFREHLRRQLEIGPAALFVCCGTGEFASLTPEEHAELVAIAVQEVGGRVPVVAGVGHGATLAVRFAAAAEQAGADGVLVLPPYLLSGGQEGLVAHSLQVAASTSLGVILYQRDNAVFEPETVARIVAERPNVIGLKDGLGDVERLQRTQTVLPDLLLLNGMPTAEVYARAYHGMGVSIYSSAVFAVVPEVSTAFHRALHAGDQELMHRLLRDFYVPFVRLRHQVPGYAVALIKAGLAVRDFPVGGVRAPLVDPTGAHLDELRALIDRGLAAVAER